MYIKWQFYFCKKSQYHVYSFLNVCYLFASGILFHYMVQVSAESSFPRESTLGAYTDFSHITQEPRKIKKYMLRVGFPRYFTLVFFV